MKCQPRLASPAKGNASHTLLLHRRAPRKGIPSTSAWPCFNAWVWLQKPPSSNCSEPAALSLPRCQLKQNTGNTNRIITINRLLEPDTGQPTPWHGHPHHRSRREKSLRAEEGVALGHSCSARNPAACLYLLPPTCLAQGAALPRQGGRRVSRSSKPWMARKCPSCQTHLTNKACQERTLQTSSDPEGG